MKRAITALSLLAFACIGVHSGCATTDNRNIEKSKHSAMAHGRASSSPGTRHADTRQLSVSSSRCVDLLPMIKKVSSETGVPVSLLVGIVRVESNFRNDVRSPVGAVGLTQCMPATARAKKCGPLDDPYENLKCGARVIKAFLKYYDNSIYLGLSGYNAGHGMPGRARKNAELPHNVEYVEKVLQAVTRFETKGCDF